MNKIYVGTKKSIELPKKGGYLLIDDKVRKIRGAHIFDPAKHSFNPLQDLDYRRICDFVDIVDAIFSRGDSTLTKDTGLDFIAERLEQRPAALRELIPPPDKKAPTGHIWAYGKMQRLLRSPVLTRVLCSPTAFSFEPDAVTVARLDRAQLGEFDALVIGLFLMAHFKDQIVLQDGGFYLRELHSALVREGRLITAVNTLSELPPKLRDLALLGETVPQGTTFDDAETLAKQACLIRGTNAYNDFVAAACS